MGFMGKNQWDFGPEDQQPYDDDYTEPEVDAGPVDSQPAVSEYAPVSGYDPGKLGDPTHRGPGKYNADVGLYSQALQALNYVPGSGFTPSEATLGEVTNWINAHGGDVSRSGDKLTFRNSLDAQGNPYVIDVAGDYDPSGGRGEFTFQDPRGNPDYDIASGTWRQQAAQGSGQGGWPNLGPAPDLSGLQSLAGQGNQPDWMNAGLQRLFDQSMSSIDKPVGSAQFESLRQPIDKARRTSMNQARAAMAGRGTLLGGGDEANAIGRIEERLAPEFASAAQRASVENTADARRTALGAAQGGTNLKQVQGDLVLRQLDQNRQWNQFLADFGLNRAQVLEMLSQGRADQLIRFYQLHLNGVGTGAEGLIG